MHLAARNLDMRLRFIRLDQDWPVAFVARKSELRMPASRCFFCEDKE
jgi:hypothetical protein